MRRLSVAVERAVCEGRLSSQCCQTGRGSRRAAAHTVVTSGNHMWDQCLRRVQVVLIKATNQCALDGSVNVTLRIREVAVPGCQDEANGRLTLQMLFM